MKGYLYLRKHESYDKYSVYKMGISKKIIKRGFTYTTGEVKRGEFCFVVKIYDIELLKIERLLQNYFLHLNFKIDGGTEFYKYEIIEQIILYLEKLKIKFNVIDINDINDEINREIIIKKLKKTNFINFLKSHKTRKALIKENPIKPNEHQIEVLNKIKDFYDVNDIGKICWSCGLGKALLSIFIVQKMNFKTVVIGVLKEGVFFDKSYRDLRKCLIQNFNVREVISVPSDQFENTSTKTSIVIFDNTEQKTQNVKFSELVIDKYEEDKFEEINNNIVLVENKGDIKAVYDKHISTASVNELLDNQICSLNGKDYNKKEIVCGKDYKLVKLGDICEFMPKSKRKAGDGSNEGKYNFYTSSDKVQKCDFVDYGDECLIIGSGGVANIKFDKNFSCSADNFVIKTKFNKYIYNLFKSNMQLLENGFTGSTIKHISKQYLQNLQIPIPKDEKKITELVDKISKPYDEMNSKRSKIIELETSIKDKIKDITENEECDEVELGSVCEYIKTGKNKTPDNKNGTLYPYYGTSEITGYTDHYLFEGKHILVARNGTMGNCFLVDNKIYPSDHIFVIKNNDQIKNITFLFYLIKLLSKEIENRSNGSTIKGISKDVLSKIKIRIPKNKKLIDDLELLFQEIEKLQDDVKNAEELYNKYIKELSNEAIPVVNTEDKIAEPIVDETNDSEIIEVKEDKPKKEKKKEKVDKPKKEKKKEKSIVA